MSANSLPRLAIIGCGAVVDYHLLPALKRQGWLPSVLIDTSPAGIKAVARKMGAKGKTVLTGSDWRAMVNEFDAAVVAVPHMLHAPIGLGLLEAGKHVFMEKPLATKVADCNRMIAAADAKGVILSVGLLRRYLRIARWTKALIASGTLGEIKSFEVREGFVFNWDTSTDAILRPTLSGGGVLMDTGAHTLDLVTWWLGDVDSIDYRDDGTGGVEADCVIELGMASGASGRVELSRTRQLSDTIRINGLKGFVEVCLAKNEVVSGSANALAFTHEGIGAKMEPQFFPELFDAELRDFKTSVTTGTKTGISSREAVNSVDVIERCYAARQPLASPWQNVDLPRLNGTRERRPTIPAGSKVLITGATGFVGGRLAEMLLEQGAEVRCVVRNFGHATRIARMGPQIIPADLGNAEQMDKAIEGVDYVFHCAHDMRSAPKNMAGLDNIIASCLKHKVRRLVYVSTFSVYEPFPDGLVDEKTRDGDRGWMYTRTKLEMETRVLGAVRDQKLPATVVQPTIVYGPYSKPWTNAPAENLIYGTVVLPGRGEGICNAVYIDDLVDGFILAATEPAAIGERFILSGPSPVSWGEFFEAMASALGTAKPEYWPAERISKANQGLLRDIKLVAQNPKRIVQIIVRWPTARHVLQTGLDNMPEPLKGLVMKHYFGSGGRRPGELMLPDPQQLKLYAAMAYCDNEKAARLIGYHPRFDFASGMEPTRRYLQWAYSDLQRSVAASQRVSPAENVGAPADVAHVG